MPDESDDDQLERELNYMAPRHDRRFFKTNPSGYNLMIGMGAVFALGGFGLGGVLTLVLLGNGPQGAPALVATLVGLVVALGMGLALPRKLWVAIGPTGRTLLRPLGYLGAFPVIVAALLGLSLLASGIRAVQSGVPVSKLFSGLRETLAEGPLRGEDWQVLSRLQGRQEVPQSMTLAEARKACAALGKGWRLPLPEDADFVRQRVTGYRWARCQFHVENDPSSKDKDRTGYLGQSKQGWRVVMDSVPVLPMGEVRHEEPVRRQVLCIRR
jgi:hypothetical protein